jgi:hypothetical protein
MLAIGAHVAKEVVVYSVPCVAADLEEARQVISKVVRIAGVCEIEVWTRIARHCAVVPVYLYCSHSRPRVLESEAASSASTLCVPHKSSGPRLISCQHPDHALGRMVAVPSANMPTNEMLTFYGHSMLTLASMPLPVGVPVAGCLGEATRTIAGNAEFDHSSTAAEISANSFALSQQDPLVIHAMNAWSACMARAGYSYTSPLKSIGDPRWRTNKPGAAKRRAATSDVYCSTQSKLTRTWSLLRVPNFAPLKRCPSRGNRHLAGRKAGVRLVGRFLTWLAERDKTINTCRQADVDEWLADAATTRHAIRTFIVWSGEQKLNSEPSVGFRRARSGQLITHDDRLDGLGRCLIGEADTVPYRVEAILLLLYAQPLVRVAAMRTEQIQVTPSEILVLLGKEPAAVPEPFAPLLRDHLADRPNLRTANTDGSPWLFPGYRAGRHLHAQSIMDRLRTLGVDLLGSRNAALRDLVRQVPAPIVATQLGCTTR